jgi:hypothetical protein
VPSERFQRGVRVGGRVVVSADCAYHEHTRD